ncbi:MAG: reverse gyrase [Archaeoglobales archaeon]|nr:reverse gyrase [Archaeoglobales archaeon]
MVNVLIYENLCPVCGGDLSFEEIERGICLNKKTRICEESELEFEKFFEKCVAPLREIQRMWAKRILRGESFSLVAPTGIGKTSFGLAMSLFLAKKRKKSYVIFPTSLLVKQAVETLKNFAGKVGMEIGLNEVKDFSVGFYHSEVERGGFFENLHNFDILITTSQFLAKNFDKLEGLKFDFVFVDDVDSVLKASRNIERILKLLDLEKKKSVLVVSTATAKVGRKAELFRRYLNFSLGSSQFFLRNIEDVIANGTSIEELLEKLGDGGIIYARSLEECEELKERLREFKVGIVTSKNLKDFEAFLKGEVKHLIGTAHHYGALVRGLDLPEKIKFAIFTGCPAYRVRVEDLEKVSPSVLRILVHFYKDDERIAKYVPKLRFIEKIADEVRGALKEVMSEREANVRDAVVRKGEIIFPDVRTYIQASGRTSRLTVNGLTKGASFLFEGDNQLLNAFIERAKFFDINFRDISEIDLDFLKREIEESRKKKRELDLIRPALFIVESPTKAKQIARFFGRPGIRMVDSVPVYEVPTEKYLLLITSTLGHLTDLVTNRGFHGVEGFTPIYTTIKRCRKCGNQFTESVCPRCRSEVYEDSYRIISSLRKVAEEAEIIIVGTDPDAEGEKIGWDLRCLLCGEIKRAEFHEVTKRAILEALNNLKLPNLNLVKAQIVRRIEDRWIGFELSQKLQNHFGKKNLSAGRAQTPALGWIIERYRDSRKKRSIAVFPDYEISLELETGEKELELKIELLEDRIEKRTPFPPYTTNSLLFDANMILKMSAKQTMQIAQELFENGLITYHRTDSTRVSEVGMAIAREYLKDDFQGREWFSEGAHECIRPTRAVDRNTLERLIDEGILVVEGFRWPHFALYDLIFRRFMASQCKEFTVRVKKYRISVAGKTFDEERIVSAEGRAYELFKSVWVKKDLAPGIHRAKVEIRKVPVSPLLSQADLIRMMKERGIGRPSTYSVILDKLFARGYIFEKNGKLIPTKEGIKVYEYLIENYERFISEARTRNLEEKMDAIERGEVDYLEALKELYEEIKIVSSR